MWRWGFGRCSDSVKVMAIEGKWVWWSQEVSLTGRVAGKELLGAMNVVDGEEQEIEGAKDKRGSSTSKRPLVPR